MKKYTTLLLDADETLLDFGAAEAVAIKTVCDTFGIAYNEQIRQTYSDINLSLWKQFEKGMVTREDIKLRRFEQFAAVTGCSAEPSDMAVCYIKALSNCGHILPDADTLCERLSKDYDMYIVTNGLAEVQKGRLGLCGLLKFFSGVFISEETGSAKPKKEFFDFVFARIPEKDKRRICIIGDSLTSDIAGGKNAGIDTCFFCPGEIPAGNTAELTARSYRDILNIFCERTN